MSHPKNHQNKEAIMAYEKTLPDGSPVMNESEFAMAYIKSLKEGGDEIKTQNVVASWHAYQRDPAGHFLSKENQVKQAEAAPPAQPVPAAASGREACQVDIYSSRACEYGTKSCTVGHVAGVPHIERDALVKEIEATRLVLEQIANGHPKPAAYAQAFLSIGKDG
jgi:hypothetical protein